MIDSLRSHPTSQAAASAPAFVTDALLRARLQAALGDRYAIQSLVGRGGSARVYAVHDNLLDRKIAAKVLGLDANPEAVERFRREGRILAGLRHPHLLPLYGVELQEEIGYLLMPLIRGETLGALLKREGRLGIDEARRILLEMAAGLGAVHAAGIVHRDIKPDNVMLEGNARHVLIMDFGIAQVDDPDRRLTGRGSLVGTAEYMSPEQAAGEGAVTTASDVYAFGVVGFEMLTGRLPFEAASLAGMLIKHAAEEAPRVERFRPDCPPVLADIVARCLAKHPADRWSGMNQIGEALATLPMEPARGLQRFLTRWWPLIDRRTARSSMVSRFRILCGSFVLVNVALFLFDLRDGVLDFAPPLLLLLGFFLAGQYGSLRHAGFSWRDLLHSGKHRVPPSD